MAKVKAPKPKKEKPVKAKKEKAPKAKKEKTPKQAKPRAPRVKYKSDLYTMALLLSFLALAATCLFLYFNNAWHSTHM